MTDFEAWQTAYYWLTGAWLADDDLGGEAPEQLSATLSTWLDELHPVAIAQPASDAVPWQLWQQALRQVVPAGQPVSDAQGLAALALFLQAQTPLELVSFGKRLAAHPTGAAAVRWAQHRQSMTPPPAPTTLPATAVAGVLWIFFAEYDTAEDPLEVGDYVEALERWQTDGDDELAAQWQHVVAASAADPTAVTREEGLQLAMDFLAASDWPAEEALKVTLQNALLQRDLAGQLNATTTARWAYAWARWQTPNATTTELFARELLGAADDDDFAADWAPRPAWQLGALTGAGLVVLRLLIAAIAQPSRLPVVQFRHAGYGALSAIGLGVLVIAAGWLVVSLVATAAIWGWRRWAAR